MTSQTEKYEAIFSLAHVVWLMYHVILFAALLVYIYLSRTVCFIELDEETDKEEGGAEI